ncbi:uncharacterized protein LOC135848547 [Planococcus citri]|uniref:uncharacterized protein LOC135848547 n=1 Tax=Planococcus citri TaxID=170843 RepID=UPI0031F9FB64
MMFLMKLLNRLLHVLILLNLVLECLTHGGDGSSSSGDSPTTVDPSVAQAVDPNPAAGNPSAQSKSRFSGIKQMFTPDAEKWRQRKEKFFSGFKRKPAAETSVKPVEGNGENLDNETNENPAEEKIIEPPAQVTPAQPVEETDTLKFAKLALVTLQILMDKKVFDNYSNPLSYKINHFDVRQHIFTRKSIKMDAYDETFMNIYNKFLYELCHPLFTLYEKRLEQDKDLADKKGNRLYNPEQTVYRVHLPPVHPPHSSVTNPPSILKEPTPDHHVTSPPRNGNKVNFANPEVTAHIPPLGKGRTPPKSELPYSQRASWMSKTSARSSRRRGPFQPRALTYSQKAVIYRVIKWASKFLIEPSYVPANKFKRRLDEVSAKYGMNLLDPKYDNLEPSIITYDCIPHKPTDMEHCCEDKDITIEYLYHISDAYMQQKQRKKAEKEERKNLGLKKEKKEKEIDDEKLSKTAKFRVKWRKCSEKYGFYPQEPNKRLAFEIVDAFRPEKFKEIFHIKPKEAKKIITQRYTIRKYQETSQRLGVQLPSASLIPGATSMGEVGFPPPYHKETNPHLIEDPVEREKAFARLDMLSRAEKKETWVQSCFVKPFCAIKNVIMSVFTSRSGSTKNQNQPTINSEHSEDEHNMQPPHHPPVHPHESSETHHTVAD